MRRLCTLIALALFLTLPGSLGAQSATEYLFTSDIHFNPMDDPALTDKLAAAPAAQWDAIFAADPRPPAGYGSDSNATLFLLALAQMKAKLSDPKVVVISGDFLAHNFRQQWNATASDYSDAAFYAFVDKTNAFIAREFDATFPHAQFIIALGNNDSPCGDYAPMPGSVFLTRFAQVWAPLVDRDGRVPDFVRDFSAFGQYVARLPNGTRAIVANSNAWSPLSSEACDPSGVARSGSIAWYERAVADAPDGAKTWVIEHIPPGIDAYSWQQKTSPTPFFYATGILARFRAARARDGKPVGLIVAAHLHNDGYRIVDRSPLLLVPSISPQHANNPAFFVAHIDDANGTIADYDAYNLQLIGASATSAFAHEYSFDAAYGVHGFSLESLDRLQAAIGADTNGVRETEAANYVSGSPVRAISPANWHTYWCANAALDTAAFAACLKQPA